MTTTMTLILLALASVVWLGWTHKAGKEHLSDERGCRWDPIYNTMRCDMAF